MTASLATLAGSAANCFRNTPGNAEPGVGKVADFCSNLALVATDILALQATAGSTAKAIFQSPANHVYVTASAITYALTSNVVTATFAAANSNVEALTSVAFPADVSTTTGWKLTSVKVYYKVGTADLDAITGTLNLQVLPAEGTVMTGSAIATTNTLPITQDEHTGTIVVDAPAFASGTGRAFTLSLLIDRAATSTLVYYGSLWLFTRS